ncbi:MAG: hypothetical protein MJE68_19470, partial [Proteobacteria bacterium]|nr:hypothetical protein [Pseudomonadota bacterium]
FSLGMSQRLLVYSDVARCPLPTPTDFEEEYYYTILYQNQPVQVQCTYFNTPDIEQLLACIHSEPCYTPTGVMHVTVMRVLNSSAFINDLTILVPSPDPTLKKVGLLTPQPDSYHVVYNM